MCFTLSDPAAACKNKYLYLVVPEFIYGKIHIANTNEKDLKKYKSTIEFTKQIISSYETDIERLKKQAASLIGFLMKEYWLS